VYEALAVSEVFQLMEQNPSANVIINNDVEPKAASCSAALPHAANNTTNDSG